MLFLMVDFVALEPSVSDLLTLLGLEPGDYSEKKKRTFEISNTLSVPEYKRIFRVEHGY